MERIIFSINEAEFMARFLCELIRQGVAYKVERFGDNFEVTITGF